jgi:hypothetical protein
LAARCVVVIGYAYARNWRTDTVKKHNANIMIVAVVGSGTVGFVFVPKPPAIINDCIENEHRSELSAVGYRPSARKSCR